MYEPRGHADMYGAVLTEPAADEADLGVIFTHNEGYSTMCGHGVIALATVLVEAGDHDGGPIRMETPAGPVTAHPTVADGRVENVAFENVPSFVVARDRRVEVPGVGTVAYDLAFGGAFYAYCRAVDAGVGLAPGDAAELVDVGRRLKAAVAADADVDIEHPHEAELSFLYGVVFTGEPENEADSRNVCVFADGEIDRCPTGTGVSGRLALRADDGRLDPGERFSVESIVGSTFTGWYGETTGVGGHEAVVPTVRGSAHLTGRHTFAVDPTDPLGEGFLLR
jgi:trans-L-3-hydroxyproline dehydratase